MIQLQIIGDYLKVSNNDPEREFYKRVRISFTQEEGDPYIELRYDGNVFAKLDDTTVDQNGDSIGIDNLPTFLVSANGTPAIGGGGATAPATGTFSIKEYSFSISDWVLVGTKYEYVVTAATHGLAEIFSIEITDDDATDKAVNLIDQTDADNNITLTVNSSIDCRFNGKIKIIGGI